MCFVGELLAARWRLCMDSSRSFQSKNEHFAKRQSHSLCASQHAVKQWGLLSKYMCFYWTSKIIVFFSPKLNFVCDNFICSIMSTQHGSGPTRKRAQKHKNSFAFKNDLHDKTPQMKKMNSLNVCEVCERCKSQIEWKIKYKKYKPLSQAKTCVK